MYKAIFWFWCILMVFSSLCLIESIWKNVFAWRRNFFIKHRIWEPPDNIDRSMIFAFSKLEFKCQQISSIIHGNLNIWCACYMMILLSLDLNILLYIVTSSVVGGLSGLLAFCVTGIHRRLNRLISETQKISH